jgi:capsular polysaccharide transport system ATP-binding protein
VIELRNIFKAYWTKSGPNVVLDNISLELPTNRSIGLLGKNGAGKSTLLRIIGAAEMPDAGEVVRQGKISWPIGFAGGFNGSLTGEENCRFIARIYSQDVDTIVDGAREFAEIGEYFYMPVKTYSSGMRARLAFGVSMTIDFDTYLVDEVTSVGDARFKQRCADAFAERADRATMVMVSHNFEVLREFCTLGAVLENGGMFITDSIEDAISYYERRIAT